MQILFGIIKLKWSGQQHEDVESICHFSPFKSMVVFLKALAGGLSTFFEASVEEGFVLLSKRQGNLLRYLVDIMGISCGYLGDIWGISCGYLPD